MNQSASSNRRKYSRIHFDANCVLHQSDNEWQCQLLDISLKGILILLPADFNGIETEPFEATIHLPDSTESIIMSLRFSHQDNNQGGFYCDYIDLDSITHLKRLVELNIGSSEMLNRELAALTHKD